MAGARPGLRRSCGPQGGPPPRRGFKAPGGAVWRHGLAGLLAFLLLVATLALPPRGAQAEDFAREVYTLSGGSLLDLCGAGDPAAECPHCHLPGPSLLPIAPMGPATPQARRRAPSRPGRTRALPRPTPPRRGLRDPPATP